MRRVLEDVALCVVVVAAFGLVEPAGEVLGSALGAAIEWLVGS